MNKIILFTFCCISTVSQNRAQWTAVGNVGNTIDISVVNASTIWTAYNLNVYLSTNGGANFTSNFLGPNQLFAVWGISATTCYAGDQEGRVSITTNGGLNWQVVLNAGGPEGFINDIVFSRTNPMIGMVFSDPPTGAGGNVWLAKTTNGGNSWSIGSGPTSAGLVGSVNSLMIIDDQFYGYGLNGYSLVRITTNGGTNWLSQNLGTGSGDVTSLAFSSDKMSGIGCRYFGQNIAKTTNTGENWITQNIGSSQAIVQCKWIEGTDIIYLSNGLIRKSTDRGNTWNIMTTGGLTNIRFIDFYKSGNNIYGYAVAISGEVLKLIDNVMGIQTISSEIPDKFSLSQNYPNPFNLTTNIKFQIPKSGFVKLTVFDVLGKEIQVLINRQLSPGTYEADFEGSSLPSGVYYYKIETDVYVETRKMVLLK
ncbi:MAG: T9SS type A sorting domain-containing protein [Chlorobi bacterium]|nr:T9SS type A sorting domain-containing protein [Chlorobiota bacterium]MCI0716053.1 T9SS type A sorting domain-containing protein [Chlorobiota bacterium]